MNPWRRPVDDIDSLFGREEAKARKESRAEESARLERMQKLQAEAEERRRVDDKASWAKVNKNACLNSFRARGVEPPELKPGEMLCSLDLLLRLGWSVQEISGKKVLVRPAPVEPWEGFTDRDSLPRDEPKRSRKKSR